MIEDDWKRAREELGGIEIPMMRGENLAITLATVFENPDQEQGENGWTPDAINGQNAVLDAIHQYYLDLFAKRRDLAEVRSMSGVCWKRYYGGKRCRIGCVVCNAPGPNLREVKP